MWDASCVAHGVVIGFRKNKLIYPVYYATKTINGAQKNYTVSEQVLLDVVYGFEKFRAY